MSAPPKFDPSLYLIVGTDAVGGRDLVGLVTAAVEGGVTLVQLREKAVPFAETVALARALKAALAPHGVPLIVNDDVQMALAAQADGLHVGQDDLAPAAARAAIGPDRLLGLSVGNLAEARLVDPALVDPALVDYVGVGPVYPTGTKPDAGAAIGLDGVAALRARLTLPLVAIGGIQAANAAEVLASGVDGLAVVSAICGAPDPARAASELRRVIDAARGGGA